METEKISAVIAAVLVDAAGEATGFSTQRYREVIEHVRQTGELPQALSPIRPAHANEQAERALSPGFADRWLQIAKTYWVLARRYTGMSRLRKKPATARHTDDASN
jgi:hypothetical protein